MTEYDMFFAGTPPETLMYWIKERYEILERKKTGIPKPWSDDPIFQRTYFCNVRREDDKVTQWIREFYSPYVDHHMFEYNIVLSRFLNWPPTLSRVGYQQTHDPNGLNNQLRQLATEGKIWGGAYVITTHGMPMPKVDYLTNDVMEAVYKRVDSLRNICQYGSGGAAAQALEEIDGIGSFLAGQIVADLKNTPGHPLHEMMDWWTFVVPGPGSIRGASWFHFNEPNKVSEGLFMSYFNEIRKYVDAHWKLPFKICNQDLQNCLCEFDKFMRVRNGTGRSKRRYEGV